MKNMLSPALCLMCAASFAEGGLSAAVSIPAEFRLPCQRPGSLIALEYDCYHYTDSKEMGTAIQAKFEKDGYRLERRTSPIKRRCNVYLPYGYDAKLSYPVIYILHGITDNEDFYLRPDGIKNILDNLISSGSCKPFVAVFPNGNSCKDFLDRSFQNQAGYYFFGNELEKDLMPLIETRYAVRRDRDGRAICGFSMGSMQTLNIGLGRLLSHFSSFGAFSAAPTSYSAFKLGTLIDAQSGYPVKLLYGLCGSEDNVALQSHNAALGTLAQQASGLDKTNFLDQRVSGGHDFQIALLGIYNFLRAFCG
jgi:enterochelin esterase-like enzyme